MMISKKVIAAIVLIAIIGIGAGSYLYQQQQEQVRVQDARKAEAETLTVAIGIEPEDLDPRSTSYESAFMIDGNCYDGLLSYDMSTGKFQPALAESWAMSPDGMVYTFQIRQGMKYASGAPINASSIKWSLDSALKLGMWAKSILGTAMDENSVKAIGDYTLQISLTQSYAPFLATLASGSALMVDPTLALQHQESGDFGMKWVSAHSAGSGPFVVQEYTRGDKVVLVRNDNYWKGAAKLGKVIIKLMFESSTQRMALERGDVDIALDLQPGDLSAVGSNTGFKLQTASSLGLVFIGMNLLFKPFDDVRIRQAVRFAIDYDGLYKNVIGSEYVTPTYTLQAKGLPGYDSRVPKQDLAKARQLMIDAGYADGFDTEFWVPAGPTTPGLSTYEAAALKIQSDLQQIGIRATIKMQEWPPLVTAFRALKVPMIIYQWTGTYPDAEYFAYLFASSKSTINWRLGWNNTQQSQALNQKYDPMVQQMEGTTDLDARTQIASNILSSLADDGPYVALFQLNPILAMNARVHGVVYNPISDFMAQFYTTWKDPLPP
jgi:peptide/nickel transport system substrate-binding protein